jgi:excisionase family DNA binding protein
LKNKKGEDLKMGDDKEILTIEEAAAFLKVGKRSIYKLAHSGKIPCKKILNKYRFVKEDLHKWVSGE